MWPRLGFSNLGAGKNKEFWKFFFKENMADLFFTVCFTILFLASVAGKPMSFSRYCKK